MYKIRIKEDVRDALRRGDKELLVSLLEQSNTTIIKELKIPGSNTMFLQGASHVTDNLLKILKSAQETTRTYEEI